MTRICLWNVDGYVSHTHKYVRRRLFGRFWTPFVKLTPRRNPYVDVSQLQENTREFLGVVEKWQKNWKRTVVDVPTQREREE